MGAIVDAVDVAVFKGELLAFIIELGLRGVEEPSAVFSCCNLRS